MKQKTAMAMAVTNDPGTESPVEILVYDVIDSYGGEWGISAAEVFAKLTEYAGRDLTVRINSAGGEATEGMAIYNSLQRHDGKIECVVDGIAASAASFIAMAGDTLTLYETSTMMLHGASTFAYGKVEDLERSMASLKVINEAMAVVYAAKSGGTVEEWRETLNKETWYTAQQAVDANLADTVIPAGRAPATPETVAAAMVQYKITTSNGSRIMAIQTEEKPAEVTQPVVVPEEAAEVPAVETEEEVETPGADTVTLDREVYEGLLESSKAAAQLENNRINALVASAVSEGKIMPSKAAHWIAQIKADASMETVLAGLASGFVPTMERGTSTDAPVASVDTDSVVRALFPNNT